MKRDLGNCGFQCSRCDYVKRAEEFCENCDHCHACCVCEDVKSLYNGKINTDAIREYELLHANELGMVFPYYDYRHAQLALDEKLQHHKYEREFGGPKKGHIAVTQSVCRIVPVQLVEARTGNGLLEANQHYYRVRSVEFIDERNSNGSVDIEFVYLDEFGNKDKTSKSVLLTTDIVDLHKTKWDFNKVSNEGNCYQFTEPNFRFAQGLVHSFAPKKWSEEIGPYAFVMVDRPSEMVIGFGLPGMRHVSYKVTFQVTRYGQERLDDYPSELRTPEYYKAENPDDIRISEVRRYEHGS